MTEKVVVQQRSGGIGFFGLLFLILLTLKLTGYIDWSWWWVTAPLWGGLALFFGVMLIAGLIALLAVGTLKAVESFERRKKQNYIPKNRKSK